MLRALAIYLLVQASVMFANASTSQPPLQLDNRLISQAAEAQRSLLPGQPSYHWPFSQPMRYALTRRNEERLLLFSYGSLMNRESAARTLSEATLATRTPALAFGIQRVYDYDPGLKRVPKGANLDQRAMLNIRVTRNPANIVNGVLFEMDKEDLIDLSNREVGYDLVPIVVTDWKDLLEGQEPHFQVAYTFCAPQGERAGRHFTDAKLKPHPDYQKLVEEGARQFGDSFLNTYHKTTYEGGGEQLVTPSSQKSS